MNYAEIETDKIVTSVINKSVLEKTYKNNDLDNIFIISKDSNENIKSIDFNPKYVNEILVYVYDEVEKNLKYLESGEIEKLNLKNLSKYKRGIIYEIPSGIIFKNGILNNLLPKIPVKLSFIGNIFCRLDTKVKDYGLNNAVITVSVVVEVETKILLPYASETKKISESIPILIKIIEGSVPNYYYDGYLKSQTITK